MTTGTAALYLKDGSVWHGKIAGAKKSVAGEVVFQTGMVGYPEALTDPSYHGQILVLTYPMIGNYGVPGDDLNEEHFSKWLESARVWATGLVIGELSKEFSHWNAKRSLHQWMEESGVPIIEGIDTRALTMKLREHGTLLGKIIVGDDPVDAIPFIDPDDRNLVDEVSIKTPSPLYNPRGNPKILAVDCGLKYNQLRCFLKRDAFVQVVPWNHPIHKEMDNFDGLFLSNGPGDPALCTTLIANLAMYMQNPQCKPVFGICMGHQILALAAGLKSYHLKYGNRGHNQPCVHNGTDKCYITSQNHGFAIDTKEITHPWEILFTNANDGTNEGIIHSEKPIFSVQFHPEHMAGPADLECLFDLFLQTVKDTKNGHPHSFREQIIRKLQTPPAPCPVTAFKPRKVLVLGSGGLSIGQAGEFDYCGSQCIKALKDEGITTVLVNPNIATVQTTKGIATKVYYLPVTVDYVEQVIRTERPDGILLNFGGQTALNCGVQLKEQGILEKYSVKVLGTPVQVIVWTEDRKLFADKLAEIGYRVAPSMVAYSLQDAVDAAQTIGYPVLVRAAYSLGGLHSGFANNVQELTEIATRALSVSPQLLLDKSLRGWKEVEYEVVRDIHDNCITVCNMENIDPLGIHTGESIVVAPSQTLTNAEYHLLRTAAIEVVRHLGVVGECNIQYALNPQSQEFYVIEVNARLSRSSALASKATGYPLAYIAAKLSIGQSLVELRNPVTGVTTACFEPSLDYCVVKVPRWDLRKFPGVSTKIGSAMKSIGEVMAIGRNFEEAFQKALRMVDEHYAGFEPYVEELSDDELSNPSDRRIFTVATALAEGYTVDRLHELTRIDRWFLYRMKNIIDFRQELRTKVAQSPSRSLLLSAKKLGFSDAQIAKLVRSTEQIIRNIRLEMGVHPWVKQIDTVAGEWPAYANYLYLTYHSQQHDVMFDAKSSAVMVLGSGVYRIGSSVEFDCCAVGCLQELRRLDRSTIMVNCNPETVSTDYDVCDKLYFEEISLEVVMDIYQLENPEGIILSMGGQLPNNIAMDLYRQNAVILGTSPESIDNAENRFKFSRLLDSIGIEQPRWSELTSIESAKEFANEVGYPCLIRPSYVLSGAAMQIAYSVSDLEEYLNKPGTIISRDRPVVISKFIENAQEIDVDAVAAQGEAICMAISEHVENAGVHSGDATLVTPPQSLSWDIVEQIRDIVEAIGDELEISGPYNLQLMLKDNKLMVIECNVRVSRSFPFVSKTLDYDFIAAATRVALGIYVDSADVTFGQENRIGVKVPMFSFSRLTNADVTLGVEMRSTGEVACYGTTKYEAFLKALIGSGFRYPRQNIFLGISNPDHRKLLTNSVKLLQSLGYKLYANTGTTEYYKTTHSIQLEEIVWPTDGSEAALAKTFDLAISIPTRRGMTPRLSIDSTHGYRLSRLTADFAIPLITDANCALILAEALTAFPKPPPLRLSTDFVTTRRLYRFPGLIDVHVHLREPGATHKEDFASGTAAALAGGITLVCCMPNTNPPVTDAESLGLAKAAAERGARCDYALFAGASVDNAATVSQLASQVMTLKMYLNDTFTTLKLDNMALWGPHLAGWPKSRPICVHAESSTLAAVLFYAHLYDRPVHICHVSNKQEILLIREAKQKGMKVTCEVAPHHLFLSTEQLATLGKRGSVKPPLATPQDQAALWENLDVIDCFATDHAPHLLSEKDGEHSPPGFPGLETMLPLLLTAVADGRLSLEDIETRLCTNPRKIFDLPVQPDTFVEVDLDEEWVIPEKQEWTKAGWSPFAGMNVRGKVQRVVLRGEEVYIDGAVLAQPGYGNDVCKDTMGTRPIKPVSIVISPAISTEAPRFRSRTSTRERTESAPQDETAADYADDHYPDTLLKPIVPRNPKRGSSAPGRKSISFVTSEEAATAPAKPATTVNQRRPTTFMPHEELMARRQSRLSVDFGISDVAGGAYGGAVHMRRSSMIPPPMAEALPFHYLICVETFTQQHIEHLFRLARYFKTCVQKNRPTGHVLSGKILANLFYTEDFGSQNAYASAMHRLGGSVIYMNPATSSVKKGESLHDTVMIMSSYADVVVLRQSYENPLEVAGWCQQKPFINAGDASGEDFVQALVDGFTIWDEIGTIRGCVVTLSGNLKSGPAHSLAKLLAKCQVGELRYVAQEQCDMPEEVSQYIDELHTTPQRLFTSLEEALPETNILYMAPLYNTGTDAAEHRRLSLTPERMTLVKPESLTGPKFRILHPLPRQHDIAPQIDKDSRAAYFRQAENGVYVRMAILAVLLKGLIERRPSETTERTLASFRRRMSSHSSRKSE
ncbi:CAD protein-like isoform X2 [Paramacrobiotus metropolitanus]|nr:CAD protein-like isoform X2 [Paramacrobiotus metropolitanus]XP_055339675.1 CAD protein-like isoform X2 [Paramacrobiotus metropolitanus]XP_055339676.1 CAD protein-like isoform X2 [Paramacrobiotus metropolitanus]XP_055339677.1 CAD protein-like isoform X2 [Paramacrobiotus metropolitanus]XP_055339678.1 CAD protein-like isoform X2 [Paramacrobiotus metropolitanus]XP_055339679.1 CAD protein-like isoform X2 [Paramacrobiotus metropolitanus]XP_055339680.1 CAD protein-like isoform X2 [Paramacrobiotus